MRLILTFSILAFAGCTSIPKLTDEGQRVRIVGTTPTGCSYIGQIDSLYNYAFGPRGGTRVDFHHAKLKNKAGELAANTIEITRIHKDDARAESYACANQSPIQPERP